MPKTILIAEDEAMLRESLAELLTEEGFEVLQAPDGRAARDLALERPVDLVLSDIRMPEMDGMHLLEHLRHIAPETPVILITAYGTVQSAVAAMRAGAADYLLKPVQFEELLLKVKRAMESRELARTSRVIIEQLAAGSVLGPQPGEPAAAAPPGRAMPPTAFGIPFHNLVGESQALRKLFEMVRKLSAVKSNVLIIGESGTGKELFARAVHYNGLTRERPFVPVNCGAIPETLIESELFGYRRGAFTGASRDKIGYFEAADGGTLFLDEISALPLAIQSSLLRVLEEKVIVPVGDTRPRPVDVRIVTASNQDLEKMVADGQFRADLLYRLNVVKLVLPPLRQRKEDVPLLAHHFLERYSREMNKRVTGISNGAMRALLNHPWRGNVRELENVIERAVIFAEGDRIELEHLPFATAGLTDEVGEDLREALRLFERQHIVQTLRRHNYDKNEAARQLGIGVSSLYRKLEELEIPKSLAEGEGAPGQEG